MSDITAWVKKKGGGRVDNALIPILQIGRNLILNS